jgi:hypothetical protein
MEYHNIDLFKGKSQAMLDQSVGERQKQALKDAVKEVKHHNEKKEGHGDHH